MKKVEHTNEQVIAILRTVPAKKLKIIQLLNEIPIVKGELDPEIAASRAKEIMAAQEEAAAYGAETENAIRNIREIL